MGEAGAQKKIETGGQEDIIINDKIVNPNELSDGISFRDDLYAENLKKSAELIENLPLKKASIGDIEQLMKFVERDIAFIAENPINEETDAKQKAKQEDILFSLKRARDIYVSTEKRKEELFNSDSVSEAHALIGKFCLDDSLGEEEKEELGKGISLRINLIEEDMKFIERNGVSEDVDERKKKELEHALSLLKNAKGMSTGIVEYARGLSRDLAAPKESDEKVQEIKNKMQLTLETIGMVMKEVNKKREVDPNYRLGEEDAIQNIESILEADIKKEGYLR